MSLDTDVLIIGAGMSGLGMAIQLIRQYNFRSFEIIEKAGDVGGTWLHNVYPQVGCDVPSHFYSYSFALNPDWSQKFSLRPEIQAYFRTLAEHYNILPRIRFHTMVESARWNEQGQFWEVKIRNGQTKEVLVKRCRILVSAVGSLSIPKPCEIPDADTFKGPLFHSAQWDTNFRWEGKEVVVLGNGCSAAQFVPAMARDAKKLTQFARSAHFLAERPNPVYSSTWKAIMRYVPLAMRLYRFKLYAEMERDFGAFDIESGATARQSLKRENEAYVKRMAPTKYWDALIPRYEIGCKRKVMDTDYLACLHNDNVELVHDDTVEQILEDGVRMKSGRIVRADAIVLATGFQVFRMLFPMEIIGEKGVSLNEYWDRNFSGAAQAYLGTCVPGFKNFFTLMGPNTVTGHLSVIYTVECQINFALRLIEPILKSTNPGRSPSSSTTVTSVNVKEPSAMRDSQWMQSKLKRLVWSSGCTSWALDPKTGINIAMYPQYQFLFWLRSIFIPSSDFEYEVSHGQGLQRRQLTIGGWKVVRNTMGTISTLLALSGGYVGVRRAGGLSEVKDLVSKMSSDLFQQSVWQLQR